MRKKVLVWCAVVVSVGVAFGLYWFQPWKLFTSHTVDQAVPAGVLVASGQLVTHEHETSGTAELLRLSTGEHRLVLRGLSTSDGPDLRVWLTDQHVIEGRDGWGVFDDGKWLELGRLKGTHGTQVYDIPAGSDVAQFKSVTIWCERFAVSFGAAPLAAA
jgi:hypothetical protein